MAAPESTKFQINYKLGDGTLVNLYATSQAELEASLTSISDLATLVTSTGTTLGTTTQSSGGAIAYAKKALGASAVSATDATAPDCKHGSMAFRSGVGQKGPWKGWMCAAPKGAVDKCETVWIRQFVRVPWNYENPACAEVGMEFFYPDRDIEDKIHTKTIVNICKICPHLAECAEWGINRERYGIWGGITANQRRDIRRRRGIVLPREEHVA